MINLRFFFTKRLWLNGVVPNAKPKKYYIDQYKKTGVIPKPLVLAAQGIMEGRQCSGRPRSLGSQVRKRFIEMVKASSDPDDPRFLFITCNARKVTSYHKWLQEDFQQKISLSALRRCVKNEKLGFYLKKTPISKMISCPILISIRNRYLI